MGKADITLAQIRDTARLIGPYIVPTPIHSWRGPEVARLLEPGTEAVLKLELLQHTGTFKVRGALSQMLRLPPEDLRSGVTAVSAGNHAIAVAYVASILGVSAKVVMMRTANPARLAAARSHGAEILLAADGAAAFAMAEELVAREGRVFIHPFEGSNVTLGTATIGLELMEQASALDAVLVAVGGGGLASGVATAVKLLHSSCRVYGVEPAGAAGMHRSFAAGAPQKLEEVVTIADSLAPPFTLPYSFGVCRERVDELVTVEDDELRRAMALIFRSLKFAVEPACAAVVAALTGPLRLALAGKRVGLIFCGSNIDFAAFSGHMRGMLQ